jgi:glycosyltransferase involved in cell wall biosynthesis
MNVLYIADPNSIHDLRWINCLVANENINGFILSRSSHYGAFGANSLRLHPNACLLSSIQDPSVIRPWRNWQQVFKIKKIISTYNIDLLHILYAEPNSLWVNWKWIFQIPVIITTRGTDILKTIPQFFRGKSLLHKIIARRYRTAFNKADVISCTSVRQVENLRTFNMTRPAMVVRTGVDFRLIAKADENCAKAFGIPRPYILMPRNMKPLYNHEFTIEAISMLDDRMKRQFCFVFVNSDTNDQSYLERVCAKARTVHTDIRFLPSVSHSQFLGLCKQSSLVVMNPLSDGSPVTAMEAMACKVPVILPPLEYDEDLFGTASFFKEWSPSSLKKKMEEILSLNVNDLAEYIGSNFYRVHNKGNTEIEMLKVKHMYERLSGQ